MDGRLVSHSYPYHQNISTELLYNDIANTKDNNVAYTIDSIRRLLYEVSQLNKQELHDSAELLGSFLISLVQKQSILNALQQNDTFAKQEGETSDFNSLANQYEAKSISKTFSCPRAYVSILNSEGKDLLLHVYLEYANALFGQGNALHALEFYQYADQIAHMLYAVNISRLNEAIEKEENLANPQVLEIRQSLMLNVDLTMKLYLHIRYLEAKCYESLDDYKKALDKLRMIPGHFLDSSKESIGDGKDESNQKLDILNTFLYNGFENQTFYRKGKHQNEYTSTENHISCPDDRLRALMLMANLYLKCGHTDEAIACFSKVLELNPYAIEASIALGRLGIKAIFKKAMKNLLH